jgi:hypothetical protein
MVVASGLGSSGQGGRPGKVAQPGSQAMPWGSPGNRPVDFKASGRFSVRAGSSIRALHAADLSMSNEAAERIRALGPIRALGEPARPGRTGSSGLWQASGVPGCLLIRAALHHPGICFIQGGGQANSHASPGQMPHPGTWSTRAKRSSGFGASKKKQVIRASGKTGRPGIREIKPSGQMRAFWPHGTFPAHSRRPYSQPYTACHHSRLIRIIPIPALIRIIPYPIWPCPEKRRLSGSKLFPANTCAGLSFRLIRLSSLSGFPGWRDNPTFPAMRSIRARNKSNPRGSRFLGISSRGPNYSYLDPAHSR